MLVTSAAQSRRFSVPVDKSIVNRIGSSDQELIDAIAKRDTHAMRALYLRHSVMVFRFVMSLTKDASLAEELVSIVFLEAWRSAASFRGNSKASTWLLGIARNQAWSALRGRREIQLDDEYAGTIEDNADTPETVADKRDRALVLQECLKNLSPAHREVIDLIYYHEKSIDEVAEILRVPPATVKTRAFYARSRMAEKLKERGIDQAVS
jgi:RNA polymerase sigma-70 factor, ECF subfamily